MANGFHTIAIQTGASNAANITEAMVYELHRYQQAQPPSILSDNKRLHRLHINDDNHRIEGMSGRAANCHIEDCRCY